MNNVMLSTYVKLAALMTLVTDRVSMKDEDGQTAAEYIGVIVVLAAVITVVVGFRTEIGETIRDGITNAIGRMTSN